MLAEAVTQGPFRGLVVEGGAAAPGTLTGCLCSLILGSRYRPAYLVARVAAAFTVRVGLAGAAGSLSGSRPSSTSLPEFRLDKRGKLRQILVGSAAKRTTLVDYSV